MIEKRMYKSKIIGIAVKPHINNNIIATSTSVNLISFPRKVNLSSLSPIKLSGLINNNDMITIAQIRNKWFDKAGLNKESTSVGAKPSGPCVLSLTTMIPSEAHSSPFAGVGKPMKFLLCLLSILNFARRRAENAGMTAGIRNKQSRKGEVNSDNGKYSCRA